jgi:hypothetical protein
MSEYNTLPISPRFIASPRTKPQTQIQIQTQANI